LIFVVLIVSLITVAGAELVRSSCQRLLQQPVRRDPDYRRVSAN
jgi:hypothetical protein